MSEFPTIRADDLRRAVAARHLAQAMLDDLIKLAARAPYGEKAKFLKRWGRA
jgi:hypothetical protein